MSAQDISRSRVSRLWSTLRSRRLAIWLLVGVSAYLALTTVVKLPRLFSNPMFLVGAAMLTASTGACAWERSRAAMRAHARARTIDVAGDIRALESPSFVVELPEGVEASDARAAARAAMRRCGLRTFEREQIVGGTANSLGLWGSPLFHSALTCLFLFAAVGQLTRAEGLMNVVAGGSTLDVASSYLTGSPAGALFLGRYTGDRIGVERIDPEHDTGGGAPGAAPYVIVADRGGERVRQWVYPNAPARVGPLTIHLDDSGPAMVVSLRFPGAKESTSVATYFPPISEAADGGHATLEIANRDTGAAYVIEFERLTGARVIARVSRDAFESPALGVGDSATLPDGTEMRIDDLTSYARLRVINDSSLPYVFAAFCLVLLGASLSVFWPTRRAVAAVSSRGDRINVRVSQRRSDPAFSLRLERALHHVLGATSESKDKA